MTLPERLRIVVPGALLVALLSLGAAAMSLCSFLDGPTLKTIVLFEATVLLGPFYLLQLDRPLAAETLTLVILAVVTTPTHAFFPRFWTAPFSILGLVAWLFCALIVAGAPA